MAKQLLVPDEKGRGFARAVRAGQFLFVSGMTGQWDLETWEPDPRAEGDTRLADQHSTGNAAPGAREASDVSSERVVCRGMGP